MTAPLDAVLERHLDAARTLGHLRRRLDPESPISFLADRLAGHIESLDAMAFPSAGELAVEFFAICGDHSVAVEEALAVVDDRVHRLRSLLGTRSK